MPTVLVLDGDPPTGKTLDAARGADRLIAADGATNVLLDAGIHPHLIVGDLDGIRADVLNTCRDLGIEIDEHPRAKNDTDGWLAFERALAEKPDEIVILGALGGRTAMTLSHLEMLRQALGVGVPACILSANETLRMADPSAPLLLDLPAGTTLNVVADTSQARVTIEGTVYDASKLTISAGSTRGLSNRTTDADARLIVHDGRALVITERAL